MGQRTTSLAFRKHNIYEAPDPGTQTFWKEQLMLVYHVVSSCLGNTDYGKAFISAAERTVPLTNLTHMAGSRLQSTFDDCMITGQPLIAIIQMLNTWQVVVDTPTVCSTYAPQTQRTVLLWSESVLSLKSSASKGKPTTDQR